MFALAAASLRNAATLEDAQRATGAVIHLAPDGSDILRGNGFLISSDGLLVTNYHLVVQAARLQVQLANGDVYDQVLLKALDPAGDLAVLKIPAFNAPHLPVSRRPLPAPGESLHLIPRGKGPAREAKVAAAYTLAPGLDLILVGGPLDALTKGCPTVNPQGDLVDITTITYQNGPQAAAVIAAARVLDLLDKPLNWPVDQMDWRSWSIVEDPALRGPLEKLGLGRRLPDPALRAEKSLARRLELALAFDPTDLQAKTLLARAYITQAAYDKAGAQIAQVLEREPDSLSVRILKGDLLQHTGDFDQARRIYQSVVDQGRQSPHLYNKDLKAVAAGPAFHDHAIAHCSGPILLGAEDLSFRPAWSDGFSVPYSNLKTVTIRPALYTGQTVYEFQLLFRSKVSNTAKSWQKEDFTLRLADREARDNLASYLRRRNVTITESTKTARTVK